MKYYKDNNNKAWAYEDDVKPEQIKTGLISISDEEFNTITNPPPTQEQLDAIAKQEKLTALANLTVTTQSNNVFDADDIARQDMQSVITASETTQLLLKSMTVENANAYIDSKKLRASFTIDFSFNITHINWKLANNTWYFAPLAEFKEAGALAIQKKGAILAGA